jgi:ribose-phosphate pyrophosphokinase
LLSPPAKENLDAADIKDICITDSVLTGPERHPKKLSIISCSDLMGEAVKRIHENESVSPLFTMEQKDFK